MESNHNPNYYALFLLVIWVTGRLCRLVRVSPMIGEMIIGLVFGPHLVNHSSGATCITAHRRNRHGIDHVRKRTPY